MAQFQERDESFMKTTPSQEGKQEAIQDLEFSAVMVESPHPHPWHPLLQDHPLALKQFLEGLEEEQLESV